jgi:transformer-2 protein
LNRSRSPSHNRTRRSPPSASGGGGGGGRRQPNEAHRENPIPSACLGVFGLSQYTTERDLKGLFEILKNKQIFCVYYFLDMFYKFGRVKNIQVVIDKKTNKSRGFGFVYFEEVESATRVRKKKRVIFLLTIYYCRLKKL